LRDIAKCSFKKRWQIIPTGDHATSDVSTSAPSLSISLLRFRSPAIRVAVHGGHIGPRAKAAARVSVPTGGQWAHFEGYLRLPGPVIPATENDPLVMRRTITLWGHSHHIVSWGRNSIYNNVLPNMRFLSLQKGYYTALMSLQWAMSLTLGGLFSWKRCAA